MDALLRDLRLAARVLLRRPGFTVTAVLCVALGVGAATVVYSFFYGVVLRPLPYPEPERVVVVWNRFLAKDLPKFRSSGEEFVDHRRDLRSFEHLAGGLGWTWNLTGAGDPDRVDGARVSASLFPLLGAEAALGRTFSRQEEVRDEKVVVLSHGFWRRRGADPGVLGETLRLDGEPHTVVGVLREDFELPLLEGDVWVPFIPNPAIPRRMRGVLVLGRLAPGVDLERAQAEVDAQAARFQGAYPELYPPDSGWGIWLSPFHEEVVGEARPLLAALLGAVLLVLAIACVNVANLLLARATGRGREMALRAALGGRRRDLLRQLLAESALLALAGGGLGVVIALGGVAALKRLDLGDLPRLARVGIEPPVLLFALAVSVAAGLLFGLLPALRASRPDLVESLKEGTRGGSAGPRRRPLAAALVVAEVALAIAVLVASGLMLRSLRGALDTDPGFRTSGVTTLELTLSRNDYPGAEERGRFYRALLERVRAAPGVSRAALVSYLPGSTVGLRGVPAVEGRVADGGEPETVAGYRMVSPGYFEVLGIPLREGRRIEPGDDAESPPVAVVDQVLADRLWPEGSPLGRRLTLPGIGPEGTWWTVVGVVGETRSEGLAADPVGQLYLPYLQFPTAAVALVLEGEPAAAAAAAWGAVRAVDPAQPVGRARGIGALLADSVARPRFHALLFGLFGGLAVVLAAVGVYGVMAHAVSQRTREIGIRMALGAARRRVLGEVVGRAMSLVALGVGFGLVLAYALVRIFAATLEGLAYGVRATDPATFAAVPVVLALVALAAAWLPALHATRVPPQTALRAER